MPPKKRGRKGKNHGTKSNEDERIKKNIKEFEDFVEIIREQIQMEAENLMQQIKERYESQRQLVPKEYLSMTLKEISALNNRTPIPQQMTPHEDDPAFNVLMNKVKSMREQRTLSTKPKKNMSIMSKTKKQNTLSIPKNQKGSSISISHKRTRTASCDNNLKPQSRKMLRLAEIASSSPFQSFKCTPVVKNPFGGLQPKRPFVKNSLAITPKFNPSTPLSSKFLRKPKVGETIMSLSGSPLENQDSKPAKPKKPSLTLTLPGGKVLNILEQSELQKLKDLQLDQETKEKLLILQQQLPGLLH